MQGSCPIGPAVRPRVVAAAGDQRADVDAVGLADDDVLAAGRERIARSHIDEPPSQGAQVTSSPHTTPEPKQVPVVQLVLLDDVVVEPVEVLLGQELAGEEARPAQAFEPAAVGAGLAARVGAIAAALGTGVAAQRTPRA